MADKNLPDVPRPAPSGTISSSGSGCKTAHEEHKFLADLERISPDLSLILSTDDLESQKQVAVASQGPQSSDGSSSSRHELATNSPPPVMIKWRWIGAKELQYLVTNRRTLPPDSPSLSESDPIDLGGEPKSSSSTATTTMEGSGVGLEKGAFVRVVTEGSRSRPSLDGGEGGRQTIAHILLPTAVGSLERGQPGNPDHPLIPRETELLVLAAAAGEEEAEAAAGAKKRKVSSVVDGRDGVSLQDLEKGGVSSVGTAAVAGAHQHGDEEDEPLCRVCHLSTVSQKKADVIDLGCACKLDLGRAHRECAETWFQVRGNKRCEICGEIAQNVHLVEPTNDSLGSNVDATIAVVAVRRPSLACWQNRPIRNFLLVFLVAAFLIPWLFRFAYYS